MKDIKNYEGLYAATEDGRVWSYRKKKFLKPGVNNFGYATVQLYNKNGSKKEFLLHRIIACTFIPNPDNLPCVNHIDEDKLNNTVSNLEYCTVAYNNCYGKRLEAIGAKKRKPVLCVELNKTFSGASIAEKTLGISGIAAVCRGIRPTAGGYHFEYV